MAEKLRGTPISLANLPDGEDENNGDEVIGISNDYQEDEDDNIV